MQKKQNGYLGCDVSKGMSNFVLEDSRGKTLVTNFQLDDNREGHKILYELIASWKKEFKIKKLVIGLESTGGYENNWYKGLRAKSKELKLEVFRINPKRIYHESKTEGQRTITDGVSAHVIASYMRKNYGQRDLTKQRLEQTNDDYASYRSHHKYIQQLIGQKTRLKNILEKLIYNYMPELLSIKGEKYPIWFLEMLIKYPSKEDLLSVGTEGFKEIKHLSLAKAERIRKAMQASVGANSDRLSRLSIKEISQDILELSKKVKRLKQGLVDVMLEKEIEKENIGIISSINGIGADTAVGIILEIGEIGRFEKARNLVAYFGINPTLKQSGDKSYKTKMSKDGSSNARAILYMAAENVVRHNDYFKSFYHKQRVKGKTHRSAIGVVMSKLTRIIFGMLKNQQVFDAGTDFYNQVKKQNKEQNKETKKKHSKNKTERRYQKADTKAPISMRQKKQRKQKKQEQNVPC